MSSDFRVFHLFLGLHSLLIGLFTFYMPVFLWQQGYSLAKICLFVAVAGAGFCAALAVWDRMRQRFALTTLFAVSLALLILLLAIVRQREALAGTPAIVVMALGYGAYNAFFWTTQRALFIELIRPEQSGRAYGNFQLFVFAVLQAGILLGGWLLEFHGFDAVVLASMIFAITGGFFLFRSQAVLPAALATNAAIGISQILAFRDDQHSRLMFLVDGCFLFFESFFWVTSLFLLAHESFTKLGMIVIVMAAIFGGLFFLLKNTIDHLGKQHMFIAAVLLYSASWLLRTQVSDAQPLLPIFVLLVLITFFTSFFRLVLNKRFYDMAAARNTEMGAGEGHRYLILKSYYSQTAIVVGFMGLALLAQRYANPQDMLRTCYYIAGVCAPLFLFYGARRYRHE